MPDPLKSEHKTNAWHPTERQRAILQLMVNGDTQLAIASNMGISLSTVRAHLSRVRSRMDAVSTYGVIARGVNEGWLTPPVNKRVTG